MKKLFIVLLICALASFLFVGCFSVAPDVDDPDPIPVMSIDANAIWWDENCIWYTVENDGDLDVHYYKLAFNVTFGKGHTPMVLYADSLGLFEVGAKLTTYVDIVCPYDPCPDPCPDPEDEPYESCCPYCGAYDVDSVEVEVLDLW